MRARSGNLAEQMRMGKVKLSYFEEEFKRGKLFAPIELEIDGKKIFIEGKSIGSMCLKAAI